MHPLMDRFTFLEIDRHRRRTNRSERWCADSAYRRVGQPFRGADNPQSLAITGKHFDPLFTCIRPLINT